MVDRTWLPHTYQDESIPPPRPTPDAWITRHDEGKFIIGGGGELFGLPIISLSEGDTVEFDWFEDYGNAQVAFAEDGTWTCSHRAPTPSDGADLLVVEPGNNVTMMVGLDAFCEAYWDNVRPAPDLSITVKFCAWSNEPVRLMFQAGKFVPAPTVN